MRLGVLHPIKKQQPLLDSVKLGLINFKNAPHCGLNGHKPAAIYFNPKELPEDLENDFLVEVEAAMA